jgi:hypothetical protein
MHIKFLAIRVGLLFIPYFQSLDKSVAFCPLTVMSRSAVFESLSLAIPGSVFPCRRWFQCGCPGRDNLLSEGKQVVKTKRHSMIGDPNPGQMVLGILSDLFV